jgi:hypothetical protein
MLLHDINEGCSFGTFFAFVGFSGARAEKQ